MEKNIYNNHKMQSLLNQFVLLRVDLSDSNAASKLIADHFDIIAPPAILFFNNNGEEAGIKISGNITPEALINVLNNMLKENSQ